MRQPSFYDNHIKSIQAKVTIRCGRVLCHGCDANAVFTCWKLMHSQFQRTGRRDLSRIKIKFGRQIPAVERRTDATVIRRGFSALKWTIVERMIWAWLLTIPISGAIAYLLMRLLQMLSHAG